MYLYARTDLGLKILFLMARTPNVRMARPDFAKVFPDLATSMRPPLETLVDAGLLSSTIGKGGGYVLTRPPEDITLLDAIQALEGDFNLIGLERSGETRGRYLSTLRKAKSAFFKELSRTTLAEVVEDKAAMEVYGVPSVPSGKRTRRKS